ncbi:MAG: ATP-dependent metallopeptidase FtsH/Yme1/Tma family protein, partial [Deltaproteobacteria bacterium]|nr:ATP-dependent metallopeptidase FtsH/Yme1/Tma family protein [Deltaproteobacteria bacterium]
MDKPGFNPFYKNLALWLVISLLVILLFNLFQRSGTVQEKLSYSEFLAQVEQGGVAAVTIQGQNIQGVTDTGLSFTTYAPNDAELLPLLRQRGVQISAKPAADSPWYMSLLASWFPMLLLVGVWIFFMRQMQMGGGKAMSFGKSRARLLSESADSINFLDVAGVEEAKEE